MHAWLGLVLGVGCQIHDTRPTDEGGRIGEWVVDVSKENPGDGYVPPWVPSDEHGVKQRIGDNYVGWIIDAHWTPPSNVKSICPGGTTVVQVILEFTHTYRPGLPAATLAALQSTFPDKANEVDTPRGPQPDGTKDPAYGGSMRVPNTNLHHAADTPGITPTARAAIQKIHARFETCVVCRGTWRPLDCVKWGYDADYKKSPSETTPDGPTYEKASDQFKSVLGTYVGP